MSDNNDMREAKDLAWKAFCEAPTSRDLGRSKVDAAVAVALEWQSQQDKGEPIAVLCREVYADHPEMNTDWHHHNPIEPGSKKHIARAESENWELLPVFDRSPPPAAVPEAVKAAFKVLDRSYYRTWRRDFERGDRSPAYVCGDVNTLAITEIIEWARKPALCDTRRPTAPASVPDGWKLVPVEPTLGMLAALAWAGDEDLALGHAEINREVISNYGAMLAASPQPTQPDNQ